MIAGGWPMTIAALVLLAVWVALLVRASRTGAAAGGAHERGGGWSNGAMLLATVLASLATCAAPIVPLVSAFETVANAPPAQKADLLARVIDEDRPLMPLALASIPILVAGWHAFAANRRRLAEASRRPLVAP